ncbi:MAG: hypothetical protein AAF601_08840 [Pseudomonadota bacterium]
MAAEEIRGTQSFDHVQQRLADLATVFEHLGNELPQGAPLDERLHLEETRRIISDLPKRNNQKSGELDLF